MLRQSPGFMKKIVLSIFCLLFTLLHAGAAIAASAKENGCYLIVHEFGELNEAIQSAKQFEPYYPTTTVRELPPRKYALTLGPIQNKQEYFDPRSDGPKFPGTMKCAQRQAFGASLYPLDERAASGEENRGARIIYAFAILAVLAFVSHKLFEDFRFSRGLDVESLWLKLKQAFPDKPEAEPQSQARFDFRSQFGAQSRYGSGAGSYSGSSSGFRSRFGSQRRFGFRKKPESQSGPNSGEQAEFERAACTHLEMLNLKPSKKYSKSRINGAFKKLARKKHPDKRADKAEAHREFIAIGASRDWLLKNYCR